MPRFRMVVAYDGTAFHGWQAQPGRRTVQGAIEAALADLLGSPVTVAGAGRTDAGVHARGQVASFEAETSIPAEGLRRALNTRLPEDVRVREAAVAAPDFHARFSARGRRYAYRLLDHEDVLFSRIAWHPRRAVDADALAAATRALEGAHDFASFRSSGSTPGTSLCHVRHARWERWEGGLRLDIAADHFLYHMVRNVVGTALDAARAESPERAMREVLEARDRRRAGVTAPPCGLSLEQVLYAEDES